MRIISSSSNSLGGSFRGCSKWVVMSLRLRLWRVFPFFPALNPRACSEKLRRMREIHRLRRGEMLGDVGVWQVSRLDAGEHCRWIAGTIPCFRSLQHSRVARHAARKVRKQQAPRGQLDTYVSGEAVVLADKLGAVVVVVPDGRNPQVNSCRLLDDGIPTSPVPFALMMLVVALDLMGRLVAVDLIRRFVFLGGESKAEWAGCSRSRLGIRGYLLLRFQGGWILCVLLLGSVMAVCHGHGWPWQYHIRQQAGWM